MKKILCVTLSLVLLLSLVACSKENKTPQIDETIPETISPSETLPPIPEDSTSESEPETLDGNFWELKDNVVAKLDAITYSEVEIDDDKMTVSKTPLSFDANTVIEKLNKNEYIANQFGNLFSYKSELHNTEYINDKSCFLIYDTEIIQDDSDMLSPLKISVTQIRNYYESPTKIVIELQHLDKETLNQAAIFDAVNVVVPDLAEYLVYGKDSDGFAANSDSTLSGEFDMDEIIGFDNCSYKIYRKISDYETSIFVEFGVSVYENKLEDFTSHVFEDESYVYQKSDFTTETLFSENYPELTPFNHEDFMFAFFGKDTYNNHTSKIDNWSYYTYEYGKNTREYLSMKIELVNNDESYADANMSVSVVTSLEDGEVSSQIIDIRIWTRDLVNPDLKKHGAAFADKLKPLLNGLTLEPFEYFEDSTTACFGKACYPLYDYELNGSIDVVFSISPTVDLRLDYYG